MKEFADVLVALSGVAFGYDAGSEVLAGVDLVLRPRERLGLVGGIGSGKTTLLHLIVGLLSPDAGRVRVLGRDRAREKDFHEVRRQVGLLFQDPEDQLFCATVAEDVAFGPLNLGLSRREVRERVEDALRQVGLPGFEHRVTHHLSGGEKRLVSLATVLAMQPRALLLDEPELGLDGPARERLIALLQSLSQALLVVSHDRAFLEAVTERRVRLRGGRLQPGDERAPAGRATYRARTDEQRG